MRAAFLWCAWLVVACSEVEPLPTRFAVRGRFEGERVLRCHVERTAGPVPPAALEAAVARALATWQATGLVEFELVATPAEANVVLGWRRGAHDACPSFGADPSVAHTGPVGPGTFVHFDAGRAWSAPGAERADGLSLEHAALHELGHVLGLDHGADEESVMYPEPDSRALALGRSDKAALHALYGGGESAPGDLEVCAPTGELLLRLPGIAPAARCAFAVFDTDGDGDDEILVWRTDADPLAGGALTTYHFAPGPLLARTLGPLYGVSTPGATLTFLTTPTGERLLLRDDRPALRFDEHGLVQPLEESPGLAPTLVRANTEEPLGDLDGAPPLERVRRTR